MTGEAILIRATHVYGFRSGQWGRIVGLDWVNDRPCYVVRFIDGVEDAWPVYDPTDPYEFASFRLPEQTLGMQS